MGYESRLYIVIKSDTKDEKGTWCEVVATYNLCCIDNNMLSKIHAYPDSDNYILEGDKFLYTDKYGKPMKEIPISDMVTILKEAIAETDYRRYPPCLTLVEFFEQHKNEWGDLVVLHYGY